jgi:hypothetical protein
MRDTSFELELLKYAKGTHHDLPLCERLEVNFSPDIWKIRLDYLKYSVKSILERYR